MFTMIEVLSHKEEDQVLIDLIFVSLSAIDRKYKTSSFLIFRVLPFRLNTLLKILDRVDLTPFLVD